MQLLAGKHRQHTYRTQNPGAAMLRTGERNPSMGALIQGSAGITTFCLKLRNLNALPGSEAEGRRARLRPCGEGAEGRAGPGAAPGRRGLFRPRGSVSVWVPRGSRPQVRSSPHGHSDSVSGIPSAALRLVAVRVTPALVPISCCVCALAFAWLSS